MKRPIRTLFYGVTHEHAEGKFATLLRMPETFEIVGVVDDRPRGTGFYVDTQLEPDGYRIVMTLAKPAGGYAAGCHTIDFGALSDRYADQLREFAQIVRGEIPNDPASYDRDLRVHRILLAMCSSDHAEYPGKAENTHGTIKTRA